MKWATATASSLRTATSRQNPWERTPSSSDGHGVPELLDAILQVIPLDTYVDKPMNLMEVMPGDPVKTPIWDTYKEIVAKHDERGAACVGNIERFQFYEEAKKAYAIIATGESAVYANVMLQKGVVIN